LVYYLRWTVLMFSAAPDRRAIPTYDVPAASGMAIGLAMAAGVAFSVLPQLAFGLAAAGSGILG
jgi:NADH:ubiquinone oxidoreductase subunit 2 (subunit N)